MVLMLPPLPPRPPLTKAVSLKGGKGAALCSGRRDMDSIRRAALTPNKAVNIPLLRRAATPRIPMYDSLSSYPQLLRYAERASPHSDHNQPSSSPTSNISGIPSNSSKISSQLIKQCTTFTTTTTTTTTTTHTRKRGTNLSSHQKQIFITYFERGMTNGSSKTLAWREEVRRITGLSLEQVGVCMFILG